MKINNPFSIRLNQEDAEMMEFVQNRTGLDRASVLRLGLRRLYQAEQVNVAAETLTIKHRQELERKGLLPEKK